MRASRLKPRKSVWTAFSLKALESAPGALTVLKPLVLAGKDELVKVMPQWRVDILLPKLPEAKEKRLVELLEYAIVQRFPELTEEEVNAMLQLTPIEQTVVGKQIYGRGFNQGELIGNIRFAQRLLKQPLSPKEELVKKTEEELKAILTQLEAELEVR